MSDQKHTPYVTGGVYKQTRRNILVYGQLIGSTTRQNGHQSGQIHTFGYVPEVVVEDSMDLDAWELISEPVPSSVLRTLEHAAVLITSLESRIAALESAATAPNREPEQPAAPDPMSVIAGAAFSPSTAIDALKNRKAR